MVDLTMELLLIRHAHAGDRHHDQHDRYRQLSTKGWGQARLIDRALAGRQIARILTSPATRCVQTVEPLAATTGLAVEECDELWEDSSRRSALDRIDLAFRSVNDEVDSPAPHPVRVAACSHGNLIPEILELLATQGVTIHGRGCEKGSIWVVTADGSGTWTEARYHSLRDNKLM